MTRAYRTGTARECREVVQALNLARGAAQDSPHVGRATYPENDENVGHARGEARPSRWAQYKPALDARHQPAPEVDGSRGCEYADDHYTTAVPNGRVPLRMQSRCSKRPRAPDGSREMGPSHHTVGAPIADRSVAKRSDRVDSQLSGGMDSLPARPAAVADTGNLRLGWGARAAHQLDQAMHLRTSKWTHSVKNSLALESDVHQCTAPHCSRQSNAQGKDVDDGFMTSLLESEVVSEYC